MIAAKPTNNNFSLALFIFIDVLVILCLFSFHLLIESYNTKHVVHVHTIKPSHNEPISSNDDEKRHPPTPITEEDTSVVQSKDEQKDNQKNQPQSDQKGNRKSNRKPDQKTDQTTDKKTHQITDKKTDKITDKKTDQDTDQNTVEKEQQQQHIEHTQPHQDYKGDNHKNQEEREGA